MVSPAEIATSQEPLSDEEVVTRVLAGETAMFEIVMRRHNQRLYRVARVAAHAFGVFGTEDNAASWLRRPNRALGGQAPIHLLDTDVGARQVEDTLGRLEHGIVS